MRSREIGQLRLQTAGSLPVKHTLRYYRTSGNLPWAINIVQGYQYTIERVSIDLGYNYFIEWASSAGVLYPNWHMNLPGYRNSEKIY